MDALRGICILGMICIHFFYDLGRVYNLEYPALFIVLKQWGGILFLLLSGICVTLGRHHIRRGTVVFACGLLCSAVTAALYLLHLADRSIIIYFGVLHCLGLCMLLWSLFSRLSPGKLCITGIIVVAVGLYLNSHAQVNSPWLVPLGIPYPNFVTADYFPLLPNLGFFLLGACVGRMLYLEKMTLLPQVNTHCVPLRFLCLCGRQSLFLYLAHQPVLIAVMWLMQHFHSQE